MNKYMLGILLALGVSFAVTAEETKKEEAKKDPIICVTNQQLDKTMTEKGYDILLKMTNDDGVVEYVWTGGQSITITASVPGQDKSCLMAIMKDVTFNPKAIEDVWETYKKQTKQKDI